MVRLNKENKFIIRCKICSSTSVNPFANHLNLPYYYCNDCKVLFNPQVRDNAEEFLGNRSAYYYRHKAVRRVMFKKEVQRLKLFCPAGRLLDFGGGAGHLALAAEKNGYDVFLVEPNPVGREVAKNKNGLKKVYQTIDEIPKDIKFDIVVLNHVIEHLVDPLWELTKIYERIKLEGLLLTTQPNFDFYRGFWYRLLRPLKLIDSEQILSKGHVFAWNINSLGYTLKKAGFDFIRVLRPLSGRRLYEKFPPFLSHLIMSIAHVMGVKPAFALLARKSKSYLLLKMLGSPLLKEPAPLQLFESEQLFEHAFRNRVGLFYLDSLLKAGRLKELKSRCRELREREKETFITASRASKVLKEAQIKHAVIKTLRLYPAIPNDIDILCLDNNAAYIRGRKAFQNQGYLFIHESYEQCGYCDPRGKFLKIEERPADDKYIGGRYFIDWYRAPAADHFQYIDKRLLRNSVVNYSPLAGIEFSALKPPDDFLLILAHSIFPHQRYCLESFYTATFWLARADSKEISCFGKLIRRHKLRRAASVYLSITAQIHREVFSCIPEKLQQLLLEIGIAEYELRLFKSGNRELPYVFSKRGVFLVLLEKMLEFNALKSIIVQFIHMINPLFLIEVIREIKEKRSKEHYRHL